MRIAIDASPLLDPYPTGVGRVAREVLRELARRELPHEILAVAPNRTPAIELPPGARTRIEPVAVPSRTKRWRLRPAEDLVRARGIDVFYSTVSAFPLRADCASVVTVHEVPWEAPRLRGDEGTGLRHRIWATLDAWYADRIVCPSQATADAFLRSNMRRGAQSKVAVVPWGIDPRFAPKAPEGELNGVDDYKFRPDYPFFLVIGTPRRKKNLDLAIRAFRVLRDRGGVDGRLFVAGPVPYQAGSDETARAMGYADGLGLRTYVTGMGYVPERDLPELYRRARATLVLSRSEGFGFPVLESMACGTPVIHGGAPALSELAGDAGIAVPDDEEEIARAMARVHEDEKLRSEKIAKGLERAAGFRWSKTVDRLLALFTEVGGTGRGAPASPAGSFATQHAAVVGAAH